MPYKSAAQRRFFHANIGKKGITAEVVEEFDRATGGKKLPEHVKPTRKINTTGSKTSPSTVKDH